MSITGLPGQGPVRAGIPIADLVAEEQAVAADGFNALNAPRMRALKRKGFSDRRLARDPRHATCG